MYLKTRAAIRRTIDRARRLPAYLAPAGSRSIMLGALLLMTASSASVVATTNTPPVFTSINLSKPTIYEGETLTLSGNFTDPDASNRHTLLIYWYGGEGEELQQRKEKVQIPTGQRTFQVSHTYGDYVTIPPIPYPSIKVVIFDHEFPTNPNDNTTGIAHDTEFVPFQFLDAKAQFDASSITVKKNHGNSSSSSSKESTPARAIRADAEVHVTIEGDLIPREALEPVQVSATWDGGTTSQSPCTLKVSSRHFQCEHTYTSPSPLKGFPVTLRVQDDEGNQATHQLSVKIP